MSDRWITTREAVQLSGYHRLTIRRLLRSGEIRGRKFVTVWQVSRQSLDAYLRKQARRGARRGPKPSH